MDLNAEKTLMIIFYEKTLLVIASSLLRTRLNDTLLSFVKSIQNLGTIIDTILKIRGHINK